MKKIIFLLISLICVCFVFSGCNILLDLMAPHTCIYSEWKVLEEPTCTKKGLEERYCLECFDEQIRQTNFADHIPATFSGLDATCTEEGKTAGQYCSECMAILSGIERIDPIGHIEVTDPAISPTDTTPGRTEGKHCSTCGEVLVKQMSVFSGNYSVAEKYHGNYAYNSLLSLENGNKLTAFYNEIDSIASDFHNSLNDAKIKKSNGKDTYYVAEINYADNGISSNEAIATWSAYVKDHPLYYWMSSGLTYTNEYITLVVNDEYADGEIREQINSDIYKTVEEYVLFASQGGDTYTVTLGFHDIIISNADYAYENDGVTPSSDISAHSILGVLLEGEGVCESYAKAFQLLLNFCGIENVFVTGYSGEPHAWNLVQLDDGEWYWYDLTWDDQPNRTLGIRHNYFCVTDDTLVSWSDGGSGKSTAFLEDHIPDVPEGEGINYNYALPDRAEQPYRGSEPILRDTIIEKDGLSYVLIGFNSLSLIQIECEGEVVIPETVAYQGGSYKVVCIGKYDCENNILTSGSVIEYDKTAKDNLDVTSIHIPSSVAHIWDFAFDYCYTIEQITVSAESEYFTSFDGVLFTKSLYTLIKYPLAKEEFSYTVPSQTVEIAFNAFGDGGNVFCPEYLSELIILEGVEIIGAYGGSFGFRDNMPIDPDEITTISGYIDRLAAMFGSGLTIK